MVLEQEDIQIMQELRKDSRQSVRDIAQKTGLGNTTVHRKLNRLLKGGFINKFTIQPNWKKIGRGTLAFILANMDYRGKKSLKLPPDITADALKRHPFVLDCTTITGSRDLILKVRTKDNEELHHFINYVRTFKDITKTETLIVLYETEEHDNIFDEPYFE